MTERVTEREDKQIDGITVELEEKREPRHPIMEKLRLIITSVIGVVIKKMVYNIYKAHKSHKGNKERR